MRNHVGAFLIAVLLLGVFFAQAVENLVAQSPVVDEPSHIARAMAYWRVGDLRLQLGHPPLIHALAGLPLLLEPTAPDVSTLAGWQAPFDRGTLNRHALYDAERATNRIVFLSRWPVLMLALLMGALMFRWAGERWGVQAAMAALFLFALDPNLLAHAALITTDLGGTLFILLAVYAFDRWARRPSLKWLALAGVAFGLALAAKFTAVILVPVLSLLAIVAGWRAGKLRLALLALASILVIGAVVVWGLYRFEIGPFKPLTFDVPAPKFWEGLLRVKERDDEGRMGFLLGQLSPRGWWYYFPVAFGVKTPLPTLLLLGAGGISGLESIVRAALSTTARKHMRGSWWTALTLLLLPALYFAASMKSSQNIGYRYILPVLPFLLIQVSALAAHTRLWRPARNVIAALCGAWLVIGAARIYPFHLEYFNEAAGGPGNGYRILADSNLDWGQNVKRLKAWLDASDIGEVRLAMYTGNVPEKYGLRALPLPGPYEWPDAQGFHRFEPEPDIYVLSSSLLQGLRLQNRDTFDWFRRQVPLARVGYSLFVYQVQERSTVNQWAAICYAPDGPLDGKGLETGLGRTAPELRSIFFDCRSAWVYVHNKGTGYYVVPARGDPTIADEMMLERATPTYSDRGDPTRPKDNPGFMLYDWNGADALQARLQALLKPSGGALDFGPASLIGYELREGSFKPGERVSLTVWWRANAPGEVLLSAYAHVMRGEQLIAGNDGLGVPPPMWQPGDVIVQRHSIQLPADASPGDYTLHVGLYSAETHKRYALRGNGDEHPRLSTLVIR